MPRLHFLCRVTTVTDPGDHVITYYYDDAGRLIGYRNKDTTKVVYTLNANGNTLTVTDEEGYVVSYVYDADGRMTGMTNARGYATSYKTGDGSASYSRKPLQ